MVKLLKIMPEYGCYPLWDVTSGLSVNISPDELHLSKDLRDKIIKWDKSFQETLDQSYPPESGFISLKELIDFNTTANEILDQLNSELHDIYSIDHYRVILSVRKKIE